MDVFESVETVVNYTHHPEFVDEAAADEEGRCY